MKPDAHGDKPLNAAIARMQHDPRIIVHLMPEPAGRQSNLDADPKKPPKPLTRPGKRARNNPNVPDELKDCHQQTTNGKRICWAYTIFQVVASRMQVGSLQLAVVVHMFCAFRRKVGHSYQQCRGAKGAADGGNPKD